MTLTRFYIDKKISKSQSFILQFINLFHTLRKVFFFFPVILKNSFRFLSLRITVLFMREFSISSSSSCYYCYYFVVSYLAMRQAYLTTGFLSNMGYNDGIEETRTRGKRKKEKKKKKKIVSLFLVPQIHTHIIFLLFAVGSSSSSFFCRRYTC